MNEVGRTATRIGTVKMFYLVQPVNLPLLQVNSWNPCTSNVSGHKQHTTSLIITSKLREMIHLH